MFQYRVTKYNPGLRNESGAFAANDWTSVSDIGRWFNGAILTREAYQQVEDAYVSTALDFLEEAGYYALRVVDLENHGQAGDVPEEGIELNGAELADTIRRLLREEFWCRLEGARCYLHFGYDYYMYVGVPGPCEAAKAKARSRGLFVEPFEGIGTDTESGLS